MSKPLKMTIRANITRTSGLLAIALSSYILFSVLFLDGEPGLAGYSIPILITYYVVPWLLRAKE